EAIISGDELRPVSDTVPSVVASSDVMGPGVTPTVQCFQEAALGGVQERHPQENVRNFLNFQQANGSGEVPPTPPFEIYPQSNNNNNNNNNHQKPAPAALRNLPKLSIPPKPSVAPPRQEP